VATGRPGILYERMGRHQVSGAIRRRRRARTFRCGILLAQKPILRMETIHT